MTPFRVVAFFVADAFRVALLRVPVELRVPDFLAEPEAFDRERPLEADLEAVDLPEAPFAEPEPFSVAFFLAGQSMFTQIRHGPR